MSKKRKRTKKAPVRNKQSQNKSSNKIKAETALVEIRDIKGYKHDYCDMIIRHGDVGGNFSEFAAEIGVNRSTLYEWAKKYPDFKEAMEVSKLKNEKFWWELAKEHMKKKFNFGVWKFVMINIHGYKDIKAVDEFEDEERHVIILPKLKEIDNKAVVDDGETQANRDMDSPAFTDEGAGI